MTECLSCLQLRFHVILVSRAVSPDLASGTMDLAVGDFLLCIVVPIFHIIRVEIPALDAPLPISRHPVLEISEYCADACEWLANVDVNGLRCNDCASKRLAGQVQGNAVDRTNKTEYVGRYFIGESEECRGLLWKEDLN